MIRKSFKTAFVALACSLGLSLGATQAFAQHAPEGAAPHGGEAAKGGEGHGGGHEGGHGEGHGGGHGHGPKPMNMADFSNKETPPYVALLVNFGLLAFAYYSLGKKPVDFAYPVGDKTSAGPREFNLASQLGFKTAVTTRPGVLFKAHRDHLMALPRISVNGDFAQHRYVKVLMSGAATAGKATAGGSSAAPVRSR